MPGTGGSWGGVGEFGDLPAPFTMPLLMLEGRTDSVLLSANPVHTQTRVTLLVQTSP